MTSVGIMASSVVGSVDDLMEPFNDLSRWSTLGGTPTIVAGRNGTALSVAGTAAAVGYTIGATNQSTWLTVGCAFRVSTLGSIRNLMALWTDNGANNLVSVTTTGAIQVTRGGSTVIAISATGLVVTNTWYYLEVQILLGAAGVANGSVEIRRNGTQVAFNGAVDTNASTGSKFQQVRIGPAGSGATQLYDDLYLTMGAGAVFKGDIVVP